MKLAPKFLLIVVLALSSACITGGKAKEEGTTSNASTQPEQKPVATIDSLTPELLAKEMGLSVDQLNENTQKLAEYLEEKSSFETLCPDDKPAYQTALCQYLAEIEERPTERSSRSRPPRIKLTNKNLNQHQSLSYTQAMRAVIKLPKGRAFTWSNQLLSHTDCPRNLSAAFLRKMEESLPEVQVLQRMEALYEHASACMKPEDPGYEILHLRQGLIRKMSGNDESARLAIDAALKATKPEERGRALYWKGALAATEEERQKVWEELTRKQPMTYHSLMVWKRQNKDPFKTFPESAYNPNERVTPKLSGKAQKSVQWLEALYLIKKSAAAEKLTRWLSSGDANLPADAILYVGSLKNSLDQFHNAIKFLTDSVVKNPELLNTTLLKQLYPVPYLDVFYRLSEGVDTFLVMGLARQESAFNPRARSTAKAEGMMQILPRVARIKMQSKKRVNLYDIEVNVKVGSRLLRDWIGQFGAVEYALIAYNAGPLRVREWKMRYPTEDMALFLDLIPFKETRNYVGSIIRNNYWYHRLYENDPAYKALQLQNPELKAHSYYSQIVKDMIQAHGSEQNPL